MIRKKQAKGFPLVVDLTGPDGNAFVLLGLASRLAKEMGYKKSEVDKLLDDMKSGDYENLVNVLDSEFGDILILER